MNETTDIQQFQSLFASWLEAGTSLEQEQELLRLACRLLNSGCDAPTRRDAELAKLSIAYRPANAEAGEFSGFVDSLTKQKAPRHQRSKWLRYAVAAALLALVAGVKMMLRAPEPAPAPAPATMPATTLAVAEQEPIAAKPETPAKTAKPEKPERPDLADLPGKSDLAERIADPATAAQLLEPREITDPQEAAEVLGKSCMLLADCLQQAEQGSQKALGTFTDNINLVSTII